MQPLSFRSFNEIYQNAVRSVLEHWTHEMQAELAAHCHAWGPGLFDFGDYLRASAIRFYKAYRSFADEGTTQKICDVGGFWGVFPTTLKTLGYDVTMTESLQYYGESFNQLFAAIADQGVRVVDFDPFVAGASLPDRFDAITVMAVLEHYPHSLKYFMENVISLLNHDGKLYLEVPNVAFWPKRVNLLLGQTPQAQLSDIFKSDVPFIGHHHEFTIGELRELATLSGLNVTSEDFYNYSPGVVFGLKAMLRHPIQTLAFSVLKDSRECLAVSCKVREKVELA